MYVCMYVQGTCLCGAQGTSREACKCMYVCMYVQGKRLCVLPEEPADVFMYVCMYIQDTRLLHISTCANMYTYTHFNKHASYLGGGAVLRGVATNLSCLHIIKYV
jgi:hypothetical protein